MALISRRLFFTAPTSATEEIRFISRSLARNLSRNYICVNSSARKARGPPRWILVRSFNDRPWNVDCRVFRIARYYFSLFFFASFTIKIVNESSSYASKKRKKEEKILIINLDSCKCSREIALPSRSTSLSTSFSHILFTLSHRFSNSTHRYSLVPPCYLQ